MKEINNPHDKFFKEMFSQIEVVQDFCRNYLPQKLVRLLDLSTLSPCKDSFIDYELSEQYSDMLLSVRVFSGEELYLYLLFEHKSFSDPLVGWQYLRYMVKIWENDRKVEQKNKLKPILPLLVYHGENGWTVLLQFQDLFPSIPELQDYLPRFQYLLIDLSQYSDDEIVGTLTLQVSLLLLKYIFHEELESKIWDIFRIIHELNRQKDIHEMLITVIKYLMSATDHVDSEYVEKVRKATLENVGETIMPTIAERWIEQGLEKGREEGRYEGLAQGILMVLQYRFGQLSENVINKVKAVGDKNTLENLYQKALSATTMDGFLNEL